MIVEVDRENEKWLEKDSEGKGYYVREFYVSAIFYFKFDMPDFG